MDGSAERSVQSPAQPGGWPAAPQPSSGVAQRSPKTGTQTAIRPASEVASGGATAHVLRAQQYGVPVGPIAEHESTSDLKRYINTFTNNPATMGGAFPTRCDKSTGPQGRKGNVASIICNQCTRPEGQSPHPWRLQYEWAFEGWQLYGCHLEHEGHELVSTQAEVMATGAGRNIPDKFDYTADLMARAGLPAKDIYKVLAVACMDANEMPTFTYKDVWDRYKRVMPAERAKDACKLVEHLAARKATDGLEYFVETDPPDGGRIDRIFIECRGGKRAWGTHRNVLIFDPTFGSNCFDMKLSMFVTVDKDGRSLVTSYMLHHSEDYDDVYWGFRCFHKVFTTPPASLLTDSGPGIMKAAAKMMMQGMPWSDTKALLCVYHLDQNFYEHVHPLFSTNRDGWDTVHNMFWNLAKRSDVDGCGELTVRFTEIREFVATYGSGATKAKVLAWLDGVLFAKKDMWVACLTWSSFSAGAHATSRGESMNSAVKGFLGDGSSGLLTIETRMDQYNMLKEFKHTCQFHAQLLRSHTQALTSIPMFIAETETYITPFAYQLLCAQFSLLFSYSVEPMPENDARSDAQRNEPAGANHLVTFQQNGTARMAKVGVAPPLRRADGATASHNMSSDLGLQDTTATHWVCLPGFEQRPPWCSCQYISSYGAPCRHIIAVFCATRPHSPGGAVFESLFEQRWMKREKQPAASQLCDGPQCQPCAGPSNGNPVNGPADKTACFADATIKMKINGFKQRMLPADQPLNIHEFDGTFMMIKYGRRNQGGWHVARMTAEEVADVMHLSFCFSDNAEASWWCTPELYANALRPDIELPKRSWLLLEHLMPDQPAAGTGIRNPRPRVQRGQPQSVRKRPAAGGPLGN